MCCIVNLCRKRLYGKIQHFFAGPFVVRKYHKMFCQHNFNDGLLFDCSSLPWIFPNTAEQSCNKHFTLFWLEMSSPELNKFYKRVSLCFNKMTRYVFQYFILTFSCKIYHSKYLLFKTVQNSNFLVQQAT